MKEIDAIDVLVNKMIGDDKAANYKGWIVSDENTGNEYVITVQLKGGETLSQQLSAAKAEIEKLSPLVEIVSNQKQSIQQLEEQLTKAKAEIAEYRAKLELIADATVYNFNCETAKPIYDLLAKHKGE